MRLRDAITQEILETPMDLENIPGAVIREVVNRTLASLPEMLSYDPNWLKDLSANVFETCSECESLVHASDALKMRSGELLCVRCQDEMEKVF